jgi:hypothetical protein
MAPVVPHVATDGLTHQISDDTREKWIRTWMGAQCVPLLQCGRYQLGVMHPPGSHAITCLDCVAAVDPQAREWSEEG